MSLCDKPAPRALSPARRQLLEAVDEMRRRLGIPYDPTATAEQAREAILADGVRPEDCLLSRGIIEAREE